MQTLNINLTDSCPAASCCGVVPLNLPASSATERRHDASSWNEEGNETCVTQQCRYIFERLVANTGWLYTHWSGRAVSGTDADILSR